MKRSRELKETRAAKETLMRALINKAEAETRDFTDAENTELEGFKNELRALDAQIKTAETVEELRARNASAHGSGSDSEASEIQKNFRMVEYVRAIADATQGKPLTGFALEVSQEAQNEARAIKGVELSGHGVPAKFLRALKSEKRDMTATGGSGGDQGGVSVQTTVGAFIDGLTDKLVLSSMGTNFMTGLTSNISLPRLNAQAAATWESEVATNDESSPTMEALSLSPKRLGTYVDVSKQLLMQSSMDVERWLINHLQKKVAVKLQSAAINGSGSSNQPTGILNTSGIGSVAGGTNGAAPTYANLVSLEEEVAVDNADFGSLYYLTNTKVRSKLKRTMFDAGSGETVWSKFDKSNPLNGYPAMVTNGVPYDLTKGTASSVCSAIIFGNFSDLIIAQWGGLDLLVNPYTKGKEAEIEVIVNSWWDIGVMHPASFAAMLDALTT